MLTQSAGLMHNKDRSEIPFLGPKIDHFALESHGLQLSLSVVCKISMHIPSSLQFNGCSNHPRMGAVLLHYIGISQNGGMSRD